MSYPYQHHFAPLYYTTLHVLPSNATCSTCSIIDFQLSTLQINHQQCKSNQSSLHHPHHSINRYHCIKDLVSIPHRCCFSPRIHVHSSSGQFTVPLLIWSKQPAKMSVVSLLGVKVLNNPAAFNASYQFEITFECLEPLQKGTGTAAFKIRDQRH